MPHGAFNLFSITAGFGCSVGLLFALPRGLLFYHTYLTLQMIMEPASGNVKSLGKIYLWYFSNR